MPRRIVRYTSPLFPGISTRSLSKYLIRMHLGGVFCFFLFVLPLGLIAQVFEEKTTSASNVRLNVTNVGTHGNAFRGYKDGSGRASCEYPAGSGVEHMFEGGFWIGGLIDGGQVAVSTSAYDASSGYSTGKGGFEFTAEPGSGIITRSTRADDPNFSTQAISHEDFSSVITDKNLIVPGTNIPIQSHLQPLNVEVKFETYNWDYSFSNFFVTLNYIITNKGSKPIDSMYFAVWQNNVVRNINITPAGSGGAAFYNKGGNGYLDSLYMGYRFDASGDIGYTESYIGEKFLGAEDKFGFHHPLTEKTFKVHYNVWEFNNTSNPVFFLPGTDQARYIKLTNGLNFDPCWKQNGNQNPDCGAQSYSDLINASGNRADLLSAGPFRDFKPGETIRVAFALVFAKKLEDGRPTSENNFTQQFNFRNNASWAQTAYNGEDGNFNGKLDAGEDADNDGKITRFILPTPPTLPKTLITAGDKQIDIFWTDKSEASVDPISKEKDFEGYRIYMAKFGYDVTAVPDLQKNLVKVAEFDLKGNNLFNETSLDAIRLKPSEYIIDPESGDTFKYHYNLKNVNNGWQYAISTTAFDRGNKTSNLESLESSILGNNFRVFPGKKANADLKKEQPFAYPDPYYAGAAWEGKSNFQEQSRKLYFANLPKNCKIRIFTAAGDFIDEIIHNGDYNGTDTRWFSTFGAENPDKNVFSGGEHAWDLLSQQAQIIARGFYIFTVEDTDTGKSYKGKFLVIK